MSGKKSIVARRLALILFAAALMVVYRTLLLYVIGYATAIAFPNWWFAIVPKHWHGIFAWAFLCHTFAVVLATLPFAWILARVYGRAGIYIGALASLILVIPDVLAMPRFWSLMSTFVVITSIVDYVKIAVALPLMVWLFLKLRSHPHEGTLPHNPEPSLAVPPR